MHDPIFPEASVAAILNFKNCEFTIFVVIKTPTLLFIFSGQVCIVWGQESNSAKLQTDIHLHGQQYK